MASCNRRGGRLRLRCLLPLLAAATLSAEHLPVKVYTTADGLAHNRIHGIVADGRGFLWISTAEGLSVFDGYRFVTYGTRDGLPNTVVNAVLPARDGTYWVATDEGLAVFHPKGAPRLFTLYHRPAPEFLHAVNALAQDASGAVWAGTDDGLYRETGPATGPASQPEWVRFDRQHNGEPEEVRALLFDRLGSLWIGAATGLYRRFPDGRTEAYSTSNGLPTTFVEKVVEDTEGRIWVGTRQGLCRIAADPRPGQQIVERVYTEKDGLGLRDIKALAVATDGTIWAGCLTGGLSSLTPGRDGAHIRTYGKAQGLSDESINALAYDREGNLWVGGESAGLMRIVRSGFLTYTQADGLASDRVTQIFEDRDGTLCVGGNNLSRHRAEIGRFDGETFRSIPYPAAYLWPWVPTLQDHSGTWWLASGGLVRLGRIPLAGISQARVEQSYRLPGFAGAFKIFEDSHGGIWVSLQGQGNRVARWAPDTGFALLPPTNGPQEQLVSAFAEDRAGNIWMGLYGNGLVRYRGGSLTQFGAADGIPEGFISCLLVDDSGRLWIGSFDGGLGRIDSPGAEHPAVRVYDASHGLISDHVTSLTADRWGRIYAGTGRGVDRIDPASDRVIHYTINDGLANDMPLTSWRDRRGWLWFGTTKGLSRLIPEPDRPSAPPPIRITGLTAAARPYAISQLGENSLAGLEFPSGEVQIAFSSMNFVAGEVILYQYRIAGGGAPWSAPGDQRSVNLAGLSPGAYRFEVRAVDSYGRVSAQPAAIAFRIPPPLWGRTWFRALCLAIGSLMLYGIYRVRLERILELERIRMRIATDLHDDIGASLSQIAILSEVARRPGEAGADELDPLGGIARISRELVDSMSDIVWAVNPQRDTLLDLTRRMRQFAGEMLVPGGIEFTFDAEGASGHVALGADLRRQIYLIFKECIHNIVRHSGATRIDIAFAMSGGDLRLTVRDNGRGFDGRQTSAGHGLASMTSRAEALGGKLLVKSAEGAGTTMVLAIPLPRRRVW